MKILPLLSSFLFFASCEQDVSNNEWPDFVERLAVSCEVDRFSADSVLVTCSVRHTIPLQADFHARDTYVIDANVELGVGGETFAISHTNYDLYKMILPFRDGAWTLTVERGGLTAHATLYPALPAPAIDSMYTLPSQEMGSTDRLSCVQITPLAIRSCTYFVEFQSLRGGTWTPDAGITVTEDNTSIQSDWAKLGNGRIFVRDPIWHQEVTPVRVKYRIFDPMFTAYSRSYRTYYNTGDPFGNEPANPNFNVSGDGIGFFWYAVEGEYKYF